MFLLYLARCTHNDTLFLGAYESGPVLLNSTCLSFRNAYQQYSGLAPSSNVLNSHYDSATPTYSILVYLTMLNARNFHFSIRISFIHSITSRLLNTHILKKHIHWLFSHCFAMPNLQETPARAVTRCVTLISSEFYCQLGYDTY